MNYVVVCGGRDFDDYELLEKKLDLLLSTVLGRITIVSGGAKGADLLGEKYADECGFEVQRFPADWEKHGKSAGFIRNDEMADIATHVVAFWDGESHGTKNMIDLAAKRGIPLRIVKYEKTKSLKEKI